MDNGSGDGKRRPVGSLKGYGIKTNWDDPKFRVLFKKYQSAYKAYLSALRKRREVRERYWVKRNYPRRPVGSPAGYKIPAEQRSSPVKRPKKTPMKLYLGDILGWITLVESAPPLPSDVDPTAFVDVNSLYDKIQLKHYHSAKRHYLDAKMALVQHDARQHLARAKDEAQYMANAQYLGIEDELDGEFERIQNEVLPVCQAALQAYRDDPRPGVLRFVIETFVDGQMVGLDEHPVMTEFSELLRKLTREGKLKLSSGR